MIDFPDTVSCNFDGGLCSWTQSTSDKTDWTRISGKTPSGNTGPVGDHTSGSEFDFYFK